MIRSGELDQRIVLQSPTTANDAKWGPQAGYSDLATVWGSVTAVSATERPVQDGVQGTASYRIVIRYRADVTSRNRIKWRGRVLDILSAIDPDGSRDELNIDAREHPQVRGSDV